jgi:hypothetical protein
MFTAEHRDQVRQHVLEIAKADPRVTAGALTGSTAFGAGDTWSDVDVAFGIATGNALETVLDDWMLVLDREFGVLDHFDLHANAGIYRVFLLASGLEVDVAVIPEDNFGARGPNFHLLFGTAQTREFPSSPPNASHLIGLSWHHVLHARVCIERNKPWQAEYWISEVRDHILTLACLRLDEAAAYARGADRLPRTITDPLVNALVRSLDEPELRRALATVTHCLIGEIEQWHPQFCARLTPLLLEFGTSDAS